jgi:hypothetical protein
MEAATASAIFAAVAILISVFETIRVARASSLIQQWTYRQMVGEDLTALSSLLTQSQLISQRQQQRNDMVEREAKRLQLHSADDLSIKGTLAALAESKAEVNRKSTLHAETRKTLAHVWDSEKSTAMTIFLPRRQCSFGQGHRSNKSPGATVVAIRVLWPAAWRGALRLAAGVGPNPRAGAASRAASENS